MNQALRLAVINSGRIDGRTKAYPHYVASVDIEPPRGRWRSRAERDTLPRPAPDVGQMAAMNDHLAHRNLIP